MMLMVRLALDWHCCLSIDALKCVCSTIAFHMRFSPLIHIHFVWSFFCRFDKFRIRLHWTIECVSVCFWHISVIFYILCCLFSSVLQFTYTSTLVLLLLLPPLLHGTASYIYFTPAIELTWRYGITCLSVCRSKH